MSVNQEAIEAGAVRIRDGLASGAPFFAGRNGTSELTALGWYMRRRQTTPTQEPYPSSARQNLEYTAGLWPSTDANIDAWVEEYFDAIGQLDCTAAGWYAPLKGPETALLTTYAPHLDAASQFPLRSLEPYYVPAELRWTRSLAGRHVAVISSFTGTIRKQLERIEDVWPASSAQGSLAEDLRAVKRWSFVQTGYSPVLAQGRAEWPDGIRNWRDAIDYCVKGVLDSGAEVCLVGCGAIGVLIAGRLKKAGVSVIVLGGATQVLFGIKGWRWYRHDIISKFWNSAWVWPAEHETPRGGAKIECDCYWRPK